MMKTKITIDGMHCASCKILIEDICKDIEGVRSCAVSMDGGTAIVEHEDACDVQSVIREINGIGSYVAKAVQLEE